MYTPKKTYSARIVNTIQVVRLQSFSRSSDFLKKLDQFFYISVNADFQETCVKFIKFFAFTLASHLGKLPFQQQGDSSTN